METNDTSVNIEEVAETQETEVTEPTESTEESTQGVSEEVADSQTDSTVQSAEDNAKYADIRRKAEEKARQKAQQEADSKFAELFGEEYGIKSMDEYFNAIKEQREQDRINKLVEQNIPEEYAKELIESKKFREQYESELKQKQEEAERLAELKEFQKEFPDAKLDEIPQEVFEDVAKGKTLTDAYSRYEVKALKAQLEQLKKTQENAQASTGSAAGNGNVPDDFISEEVFQTNRSNMNWVTRNYDKIQKSRAKW